MEAAQLRPQHGGDMPQRHSLQSGPLLRSELSPGHAGQAGGEREPRGQGQALENETSTGRA